MSSPYHPHIPHPRDFLTAERRVVGRINDWIARGLTHVLGSMAAFWLSFIIPLIAIPASDLVKLIVAVVFSSWFQAWALPVLQIGQLKDSAQQAAKADADHAALVHLADTVDAIHQQVTGGKP
jgi:hypothetical protein